MARPADATGSSRRSGAVAVELALILPLLVLIVLGAVDFGRFANTYIAVTNACRAGANPRSYFSRTIGKVWRAFRRSRSPSAAP